MSPFLQNVSQMDDKVDCGYGTALLFLVTLYINQLCSVDQNKLLRAYVYIHFRKMFFLPLVM